MPDVLLRITATNTAGAAIEQAARALGGLDQALAGVGAGSGRVQAAINAVGITTAQQATALDRAALAADNLARMQARLNGASGDTGRLQDQIARALGQSVTASNQAAEATTRQANAVATLNQRLQEQAAAQAKAASYDPRISPATGGVAGAYGPAAPVYPVDAAITRRGGVSGAYGPAAPGYLALQTPAATYDPQARAAQSYADQVIARNQGTLGGLNAAPTAPPAEPVPVPAGGGRESGGGSGIGDFARNYLLYGVGYQLGGAVTGGVGSSVSRNAQYSRLLGTTQGFTGGSAADQAEIDRFIQSQAASGTLPYTPTTLLQGYYGLASADISGGTRNTEAIAARSAQLAAASGDADPSGYNQAILALIGAYNQNGPGVAAAANTDFNQLTAGVIKGQLEPSDFAAVIPRAKASIGKAAGVSSADLIAYLSAESNVGISADQGALDFGSLVQQLVRPNGVQLRVAKAAGVDLSPGFLQRDGGLAGFLGQLQTLTAGLSEPQRATFLAGLLNNKAAGGGLAAVLGDRKNAGIFGYVANADKNNVAQSAINAFEATPGAKLANSQAQFETALDSLTKTALPHFITAIQGVTTVLKDISDLGKGPGGKGGLGASVSAGTDVLNRVLNPFDAAFGNVDKAKQEVAAEITRQRKQPSKPSSLLGTPTGSGLFDADPSVAAFLNGIGGAKDGLVKGIGGAKDSLLRGFTNGTGAARAAGIYAGAGEDYGYGGIRSLAGAQAITPAKVGGDQEVYGYAHLQTPTGAAATRSAAANLALARAGLAQAEIPGRGTGAARTAAARSVRFVDAPGVGALEAGPGSTAVRFAGQLDPEATELRQLRQENSQLRAENRTDNARIIGLLAQLVGQGARQGARAPNAVVAAGGGRGYKG